MTDRYRTIVTKMAFWCKVFGRLCPRSLDPMSDDSDDAVVQPTPPKKRTRSIIVQTPRQTKKKSVTFADAEPKRERDIPLTERTRADDVPIDTLNRGTERYTAAPRAVITSHTAGGRHLVVALAPQGRRKARQLQCAQLDREVVCERIAGHKRAMDVAIWEPELFWNGRFYGVLSL